ncbi:MAG TPA: chromosomal replication initiator protein DnaA [Rhabdochlamydiaceae bacterium]|jgi:chromosomal replication initiator protein
MQAWEDFLKKQDSLLGKQTVDKWLRTLKVVHFDSGNLYLEANEAFHISWFEEHIRPLLKTQLSNNNFRPIKVHLNVTEASPVKADKKEKAPPPFNYAPDALNPMATLDTFVTGSSNQVIFTLLTELASCAGDSVTLGAFNPLFIWGGSGSGKTHMLMALAHAFKKKGLLSLYARTETFTEHFVSAIRNSEMQRFRKAYRTPDVLLIDDVHLLARKDATQEEFFHTFNTLHTSGRQIILTANQPPSLLEEIEPRLLSRFEWGIALHLEKLSPKELLEVLKLRCEHLRFCLSKEVQDFLVESFPQAHSLHRALEALILRAQLHGNALYQRQPHLIDKTCAKEFLNDLLEKERDNDLTPQKIIGAISAYYGIRNEDILGKSQVQECVAPRQLAMYMCRKELQLSFTAIGRIFSRDHSTVMTSVKNIQKRLDQQDRAIVGPLFEITRIF